MNINHAYDMIRLSLNYIAINDTSYNDSLKWTLNS